MGTYHSFISPPLSYAEAFKLKEQLTTILNESNFDNNGSNVYIQGIRTMYVVLGIYKNLGGYPAELIQVDNIELACISNEDDKNFV